MQKYLGGAAVAALLSLSLPAYGTVVTSTSGPVTIDWSENVTNGGVSATLSGDLVLSNFNFDGSNSVTFNVYVENDTQQGTLTAEQLASVRLVSFGFDTNPDATTVSDTSTDWSTTQSVTFPGFQTVDVCVWDGQNCSGGGNEGLTPGQSASFAITLGGFATDITSIDLGIGSTEEFTARFQTAFSSFTFSNPPNPPPDDDPPDDPPNGIPEPGSLALLGGMLAGAGWLIRRRHNRA